MPEFIEVILLHLVHIIGISILSRNVKKWANYISLAAHFLFQKLYTDRLLTTLHTKDFDILAHT